MTKKVFEINQERFLKTFQKSSSIGTIPNGGLKRLALSQEDKEMRDVFASWLEEAGLEVRYDDFGNMYGRREGKLKDAPAVAVGSHLDTQPTGGRFDGILGVLAGLEVVRTLNDHQIETDYPIEVINFTNEEGARFEPPMLGSGGIAEVFTKEFVHSSSDVEGVTYGEALKEIGYLGKSTDRIQAIKNYIELHIEQGPVLEEKNLDIGVVKGIQGMSWLQVKVTGKTIHAGPTPMENRVDALVPASKMIVAANDLTKSFTGLLTTVGKIENHPNIVNIVPGEVVFSVDVRHVEDEIRLKAIEQFKEEAKAIASAHGVVIDITHDWDSEAVHFAPEVTDAIEEAATMFDYSTNEMYSGAGHDAAYMNRLADTAMIFVKSIDGISHNEAELTLDEDLVKGTNVLLHVVKKLATK